MVYKSTFVLLFLDNVFLFHILAFTQLYHIAGTMLPTNCVSNVNTAMHCVTFVVVLIMNAFFLLPYCVLMAVVTFHYLALEYEQLLLLSSFVVIQ